MRTPSPSAESHELPHDAHAHARPHSAHVAEEESQAAESLWGHVRRSWHATICAAETAILDPCIGFLQRLRQHVAGAPVPDTDADEDRPRSRVDRPTGRHGADAHADAHAVVAEAPKPRRRLRGFLIYLSVFLVGGIGGGVSAYELLENILYRQVAEGRRLKLTVAKQNKSAAMAQKEIAESGKKIEELEKQLKDSTRESQARLDAMQKTLTPAQLAEAASLTEAIKHANPSPPDGAGGNTRTARTNLSGNCDLGSGNVAAALKDCVQGGQR